MILLPRPRFSGPVEHRDATILLAVAAALVAARIPSGFVLLLLLPLVVVVVQGIRRSAPWPRPLRLLVVWCLAASALTALATSPLLFASTGSNVVIAAAVGLVGLATFSAGRPRRAAERLVDGLYLGFLLVWAISCFEALSGFKFSSVLYPSSEVFAQVANKRFFVSAFFPNYNDYSVAMVMLVTCLVARLVFQPRRWPTTAGRWAVLLSATFFVVYMGSRGALLALLLGAAVIMLLSVRMLHPRAVTIRHATLGLALVAAAGAVVWQSPYVQDNSTAVRGKILGNVLEMLGQEPMRALFGWASYTGYTDAAAASYGDILMDPHNLLLEYVVRYGLPALLLYLWCLWRIARMALQDRVAPDWRMVAALATSLMMPVVGVVASSTLRYHVLWLWLVAAFALAAPRRREGLDAQPIATSESSRLV